MYYLNFVFLSKEEGEVTLVPHPRPVTEDRLPVTMATDRTGAEVGGADIGEEQEVVEKEEEGEGEEVDIGVEKEEEGEVPVEREATTESPRTRNSKSQIQVGVVYLRLRH